MKESVSNVLRWISLPFVFFGVFFIVHILAMLLNGGSISRLTYDGGPLPIIPMMLVTMFAGAISAGATIYACMSVAPSKKRIVVWVVGILLIALCAFASAYALITHNSTLELIRRLIDNISSIVASVLVMKTILEDEL